MTAPPTPRPTVIAGRYSLEREIGRGGAGVVWLGRDERLGRPVALKRIGHLIGESEADLTRAERESRLAAQLHHPHVVSVFDAVTEDASGARWLVMEFVDGPSLAQLVRERGPMSPDEAAPLIRQAAEGLAAAHAAGIAHRDVKPSNILVGRHESGGQVKITDFGIARLAGDASITQTGMVTGSPAYLSPEVASGRRGDEGADVWALGATLFHLLAGRPPYDLGDNVVGGLYRIVHEEPPRLTDAGWLGPLLEGTMAKDPTRRWTMAQVRDYLAAAGRVAIPAPAPAPAPAPEPVGVSASSDATRVVAPAAPEPRRRRLLPVLVVVLLVALVGGLWAILRDLSPDEAGARGASSPSASASSQTREPTAAGMADFIRSYVAATGDDPATSWRMLTAKFQRASGGFAKYDEFWGPATNGTVGSITADPDNLTVSYQVRFDDHDNGPGPTVLQLAFDAKTGTYKIDGESTRGFEPAG